MNREELLRQWREEERRGMEGWDFSHLEGRYTVPALPWDYCQRVKEFLRPGVRLLDMGTGGGEFLLGLHHPFGLTSVTEGWAPNLELCRRRLAPLGITVREYGSEQGGPMPFADDSFDLVLSRHESYDLQEVRRVLKRDGFFVTQQVGGENNRPLIQRLCLGFSGNYVGFNLERELPRFREAGFRVMNSNQAYLEGRFLDVGALVFQASVTPWEFPGFSVDACQDALFQLQAQVESRGFLPTVEHRFLIVAKNRKEKGALPTKD